MNTFSVRQGIKNPENLNPDSMTDELRNRIWNAVKFYINNSFKYGNPNRDEVIELLWDKFFKKDVDNLNSWDSYR